MILETFMDIYHAKYYQDVVGDGFSFPIKAESFEKAAVGAIQELETRTIILTNKHTWNAEIVNSKGKIYKILEEGKLLVNPKTGKKPSSLEEKLD